MLKYDKNGEDINIATEEYVNNKRETLITINSVDDLNLLLNKYDGMCINLGNEKAMQINGVIIPSWSRWFIPFVTYGDCFGIIVYPDASHFYILGHTSGGFHVSQIK